MKIYRLAKRKYVQDLTGEGARLYGGRWNKKGDAMLYFSENLSLCVLELLVHMDYKFFTSDYEFIEVEISEELLATLSKPTGISKSWRSNPPISHTQDYGSKWLSSQNMLGLSVPSAVLPTENNILINPKHKNISEIKILKRSRLDIDVRLLKLE